MRHVSPSLALVIAALTLAPIALAGPPSKKPPSDPALPPAPARLWVTGPSAKEPWTLRIDNVGLLPIRVPADIRLLSFDIETHEKGKKPVHCAAPAGLRPETFPDRRALLLAPGESYVEPFDVHLFCFGKHADALVGGNVVRVHFGWDPPKNGRKAKLEPPFAAQGTVFPATNDPLKELLAPTMVLAYGPIALATDTPPDSTDAKSPPPGAADVSAKAAAKDAAKDAVNEAPKTVEASDSVDAAEAAAPATIVDENAPRLEVTSEPYSDATQKRDIRIAITVKNVGHRPLLVAIQPRNFAFKVSGPDGRTVCDHFPTTHAVPRDFYRKLRPNDTAAFSVMLNEQCPRLDFNRPGLYSVTPILHAVEAGSELALSAWTGVVRANAPTLLRLATGDLAFYKSAAQAIPTPKPDESSD